MEISLNGKKQKSNSSTLAELVQETGMSAESLIAEVNLKVIQQKAWQNTPLKDGDQIELLSFVGGG